MEEDEDTAETTALSKFDAASLTGSSLEDNILLQNNGQNVLLPGDTRSLNISFNIPDTWGGEKCVRVEIADIQYISPVPLNAPDVADDDFNVSSYHISEDDTPTFNLSIVASAATDTSNLATGEVRRRTTDEDGNFTGNSSIPKTGDSANFNILLAAIAAAAAGFTAYSARRSAIESAELDEKSNVKNLNSH